jgi:hypothetical protein
VRNAFNRTGGGRSLVRIFLCRVRPRFFRRIGLFPLDIGHLAERMFFTGYAKEQHAKRNADDDLAEEASHSALPQVSVSGLARKDESAVVAAFVSNATPWPQRAPLQNIERRALQVTIRRGGPHG